jgi:putative endonuclease
MGCDRRTVRQRLGARGERLAAELLRSRGYRIVATNVRFPVGELDVVAWERGTLCLIEIRSVSSPHWGGALASITDRKRRRIIRAARWYLNRLRPMPRAVRFDVVAIEWHDDGRPALELVQGAFDDDGSWG